MSSMTERSSPLASFVIIAFLLGTFLTALMFHTLEIHNDNVQILQKIHKLYFLGEWSHFGNRGTGVGFVPGSLMTAITTWPLYVYYSIYSACFIIFLTHIASLGMLWDATKQLHLPLVGAFLFLMFWLNPWRVEQAELYNPAYLFFFASLHYWTAMKMQSKNWWATCLHVLSIGLCLQFHYSVLILIIASLLLFYFQWYRVHWLGFTLGVVLTAASLVPWFLAYISTPELGITVADPNKAFVGRNALFVYPVIKAALYWFRYGSTYYARHIFTEIEFSWISWPLLKLSLSSLFHSLKWVLAIVTLGWSFRFHYILFRRARRKKYFKRSAPASENPFDLFYRYLCFLFVAMILSAALSPVEFNHWHLILCFPAVSVFISVNLALRWQRWSHRRLKSFFVYTTVIFFVFGLLAAFGSRSHSINNNYHQLSLKFIEGR